MMGVETVVYVKVVKEYVGWIEVSAVTLTEAKKIAREDLDVIKVIDAQYNDPYCEKDNSDES